MLELIGDVGTFLSSPEEFSPNTCAKLHKRQYYLKLELAIVVDFAHHFVKATGYGLNGLVKRFCAEVGIFGNFPGHSGKVTCATEL